jgi:hypothetical protein
MQQHQSLVAKEKLVVIDWLEQLKMQSCHQKLILPVSPPKNLLLQKCVTEPSAELNLDIHLIQ